MKKLKQDLVVLPSHFFGEEALVKIEETGTDEQKRMAKLLFEGNMVKQQIIFKNILLSGPAKSNNVSNISGRRPSRMDHSCRGIDSHRRKDS